MDIDGTTTALVTGANGGIGAAIARALHRKGARVILSGRRASALAPLAEELGARAIVADLANPADAARLCDEAGDVDLAVLNAAVPASGLLFDHGPEEIESILRVNLAAPILAARTLGRGMVARRKGQLVLISSVSGLVAAPGASLYCATKFGMRGFALSLRAELAHHGVGVTTIYPGFIRDAGMFAMSGAKLPPGVGTRSPEDVANAVLRAARGNPSEITVAALDQRLAAFAAAIAPGVVDLATRYLPATRRLAAEVAAGQRKHLAARDRDAAE